MIPKGIGLAIIILVVYFGGFLTGYGFGKKGGAKMDGKETDG